MIPIQLGSEYYQFPKAMEVLGELRVPNSNSESGPGVIGIGAIRWNPTTSRNQSWNGTEWVDIGTGTSGIIIGTKTITADGLTDSFSWNHDLGFDPTISGFTIDPISQPAQGIYSKSADATKFYVTYDICPVGDLIFNTTAKKP